MRAGAQTVSRKQRVVCLGVILGVSTRELKHLKLSEDVAVEVGPYEIVASHAQAFDDEIPAKMSYEDRLNTVYAWLQDHISARLMVEVQESGSSPNKQEVEKRFRSHLQPLLSQALDAYNACKQASSSAKSSTWYVTTQNACSLISQVLGSESR
jgi:tRNA pseudouridine-54 N-methylase